MAGSGKGVRQEVGGWSKKMVVGGRLASKIGGAIGGRWKFFNVVKKFFFIVLYILCESIYINPTEERSRYSC